MVLSVSLLKITKKETKHEITENMVIYLNPTLRKAKILSAIRLNNRTIKGENP